MAANDPIKGTGGSCKIGPSGTAVTIAHVKDWTYKSEYATSELGPYVGSEAIDEVTGGEKGELSFNCDVREAVDAGQEAVLAKKGLRDRFEFITTGGLAITIASGLVKQAEVKTEAKGTQTLAITVAGVAVIAPAV